MWVTLKVYFCQTLINIIKMKKLTIIIKQLIKIVTFNTSYPTTEINLVKYGAYEFKNGICEYNQYRTLINYLTDNK